MKTAKTIKDVKVGGIYRILDIVRIEADYGVDIKWYQVGSRGCKVTSITML